MKACGWPKGLALAGVVVLAPLGCDHVRPIKWPADDVRIKIARDVEALPDDCEVREVDADCHLDGLRVECDDAPPKEAYVGLVRRCDWPGTEEEFRRAVCRAGGDSIVPYLSMTDSCVQESFEDESRSGTTVSLYGIYRLRSR